MITHEKRNTATAMKNRVQTAIKYETAAAAANRRLYIQDGGIPRDSSATV